MKDFEGGYAYEKAIKVNFTLDFQNNKILYADTRTYIRFELLTMNMIPSFPKPYCLISFMYAAKAKLCPPKKHFKMYNR